MSKSDALRKMVKLKVISIFKKGKRKYAVCKCECGKIKSIRYDHLCNGNIKSCGCIKIRDISDNEFGKLKAIKYEFTKNKNAHWLCECTCGNKIIVSKTSLVSGNTKSCGCLTQVLRKNTCVSKYGKDFAIKNKECLLKRDKTNIKRYGVKNVAQNKDILNKRAKSYLNKYGVDNPMKDPGVALIAAKSNNNSYSLVHWKTGEEVVCVASYEASVVNYLNKNKIDYKWQHKTFKITLSSGRETSYRPDLYIIGRKRPWIEIKGYFRGDSMEKWDIFHNHIKPNSDLWDKNKLKSMGII